MKVSVRSLWLATALGVGTLATPLSHAQSWDVSAYNKAMKESERTGELSAKEFARIQENKTKALVRIEKYLDERFGKADPLVLKAFKELPREYYHYDYSTKRSFAASAYEADAKPWAVGFGSALSHR